MTTKYFRPRAIVAALSMVSAFGSTWAFEISNDQADLTIRWDNTFRYNLMSRVEKPNAHILASVNSDDGDRNFGRGIVSNRLDLLSEFDVVYRDTTGLRLSGAAWYDAAYGSLDNTSSATSNHLVNGTPSAGLSDATERFHKGPSGEFLDAFVFGRVNLGDMPLNLKAGRHTMYWGESLLSPIHGLSYGQAPLDLRKAAAVPGTEAKELFLPRAALSAQLQASPELSLAAQYFLDWKPFRIPEAGSYLGAADMLLDGGESLITPQGTLVRGSDVRPDKRGDWGLAARWRPEFLDGTVGAYVRRTSDIQPQIHVNPFGGTYHLVYPSNIDILGLSLAKSIAGVSVGVDLNYRRNMPLATGGIAILPQAYATAGSITALPSSGNTGGPLGNTWHGVVNAMSSFGQTALFDSAISIVELQWNRWAKVTQNAAAFNGADSYTGIDKVTKDYFGLGMTFTPTWYQALPGVDLLAPMVYTVGLSGHSAVSGGGNERSGNYSVGIGADVYQKYRVDVAYVDTFGPFRTDASTGAITSAAGGMPFTKDRGFLSLTFKTTF